MLTAFKEQLRTLAADPKDGFHVKIRKRVGKRATLLLEKRLKRTILLMPGLVARIYRHWREETASGEVKKLGGFLLTYLYHPADFLPEKVHGLFGYLDDAYLVLGVYEKVVRDVSMNGAKLSDWDKKFLEEFPLLRKSVRQVIPDEAEKVDALIQGIGEGRNEVFESLFSEV